MQKSTNEFWIKLNLAWQKCASLPWRCWATSVAVSDGNVYIATNRDTGFCVYDPINDKWSQLSSPPYKDFSIVAVPNMKQLLAIGGIVNKKVTNEVFLWDKINEKWIGSPYPNMPTSRYRCSSISYGSKVIVAGGITHHGTLTTAVEVLHINDTSPYDSYWVVAENIPFAFATFGSIPLIIDKRLYIAAGYEANLFGTHKVVTASLPDLLQSSSDNIHSGQIWSRLPNLPYCSRSINHYRGHLVTFSGDYLDEPYKEWESVSLIHMYNPDTKSWDRVGEVVPHDYYFGMSVHLSENKILFVGGLIGSHDPNIDYDMLTTCWTLTITPKHPSIIPY